MTANELRDLLEDALSSAPPPDGADEKESLAIIRDRIDRLDAAIVMLLNHRSVCANKIGDLKKRLGVPVYVPRRESEVLKNVQSSNPGPLRDEAICRLFERIIDETRSLERKLYQEGDKTQDDEAES